MVINFAASLPRPRSNSLGRHVSFGANTVNQFSNSQRDGFEEFMPSSASQKWDFEDDDPDDFITRPSRGRSGSFSSPSNRPSLQTPSDYQHCLMRILSLTEYGGRAKYIFGRKANETIDFAVNYTNFCGLSLAGQNFRQLFKEGDILYELGCGKFRTSHNHEEYRLWNVRFADFYNPHGGSYNFVRRTEPFSSQSQRYKVWVTFGRVKSISFRKKFMIIATNVEGGLIYVDESSLPSMEGYEANISVLVRAELRIGNPNQGTNIGWFATYVCKVGKVEEGSGKLVKIRRHKMQKDPAYVIVANNFGWVMVPREEQAKCNAKMMKMGGNSLRSVPVQFKAGANLPCYRYGEGETLKHRWKVLAFTDTSLPCCGASPATPEVPFSEKAPLTLAPSTTPLVPRPFSSAVSVMPSNFSVATSCHTCYGELVCVCYH